MRRIHHPTYYTLADQLDAEELRARGYANQFRHNHLVEEDSMFKRLIRSQALPFGISMAACISVCVLWYLYLHQTPAPKQTITAPVVSEVKETKISGEPRDIEHDVTLMKDVLRSLVTTVDRLSLQNQPTHELQSQDTEFKSAPFKITSERANLREYPSRESASVVAVPKDTILMGVGFSDGWIKTFAPNGKEAWVHSSITSKIESGK